MTVSDFFIKYIDDRTNRNGRQVCSLHSLQVHQAQAALAGQAQLPSDLIARLHSV